MNMPLNTELTDETAESLALHRQEVVLPMPTGFKNGTDGGIAVATDAMRSASHPHHHLGVSATGVPAGISREVMAQRRAGNRHICGLMLESFLESGRQNDGEDLRYGCSITDPCLWWAQTEALIRSL